MIIINDSVKERWNEQLKKEESLQQCMHSLEKWDGIITIYSDHDPLSFFFVQRYDNGECGVCGGIIYHGARDGYGNGSAPTFSTCITPTQGYSIHT